MTFDMTYDPFARGPYPVGVRTDTWHDADRNRSLTVEIWYPATDEFLGRDRDPATWDTFVPIWAADEIETVDTLAHQEAVRDAEMRANPNNWPLVLLIHGWAGYRQESTFIGTHLASRGYVVVSPDVAGSTWNDVDSFLTACEPSAPPEQLINHSLSIAHARVGDIPFLIDSAVAQLPVWTNRVAVTGASFGGFSSVIAPASDERVCAIAAMCPANDDAPIVAPHHLFTPFLTAPWKFDAAALILAADRDSLLPLYGQLRLLHSLPSSNKKLVALARADHNHFVDDIEVGQAWMGEFAARVARIFPDGPGDWELVARSVQPIERLVAGETAKTAWRGVIAAHFDAHVHGVREARDAVDDLGGMLSAVGVEATVVEGAQVTSAHDH